MGSNDQYITAGIILLVTILIGTAVYKFMPGTVSDFVQNTVSNILNQFP
ncbi:MAG: hypothetical protein K6V97_11195 [Actinomycetia bacterium]|nr:hypothetical protein [Actinomycetes bacterium]